MRGVGEASGAVTIINALSTGVGCAVAVSLRVRAELELRRSGRPGTSRIQVERPADSALVQETLRAGLARFAPGETYSGELVLQSEVPVSRGLKSSSAVGVAVLAAAATALHQNRPPTELARLASEVAQEIGLSATGAFDDCLACIQGGIALTDNSTRSALRAPPFDSDLEVVLWIPEATHAPSTGYQSRFRENGVEGTEAVRAARAGDWARAMSLNTELVERVMGYDYGALRERLLRAGARMAGVSGMGPALAAFVRAEDAAAVQAQLPNDGAEIRHVRVRTSVRPLPEETG